MVGMRQAVKDMVEVIQKAPGKAER
ncbi:MAG: hypothetical protein H6Q45_336, partial [Deltaproteobacteria bacterium]|nr:hypothetical protein [Deltaproteobacteria bacterium]